MSARATVILAALFGAALVLVGMMAGAELLDDDNDDNGHPDALDFYGAVAEAAEDAPACSDVFVPGRPVADVLADAESGPCMDGDEVTVTMTASWECPDGTRVHDAGDFGWGRDGATWQGPDVPEPYAACSAGA